ncbi:Protein tyrosine phosphatase domain-containing protein 1 [Chytridiales sp. JEL 0842]|nr:Protein tyrosine phosphatase domain-containing protein 1 [Chytridiales sp. JEL 0842]
MQRPSNRLMEEFKLVETFKGHGIKAIFNCQLPGEHELCGDGLDPTSGFSYNPETWMHNDVFYYNFGWKDMTVPKLDFILQMVQVMAFSTENDGKAIKKVRAARPLSIQTPKQQKFIYRFKAYLLRLRAVYPMTITIMSYTGDPVRMHMEHLPFMVVMSHQRMYLRGGEQRMYRYIPKVIHVLVKRIKEIMSHLSTADKFSALCRHVSEFQFGSKIPAKLLWVMREMNEGVWKSVDNETSPLVLIDLMLYFVALLKEPLFPDELIQSIMESPPHTELLTLAEKFNKELFWTLNIMMDIFRNIPSQTPLNECLYRLAYLLTSHREESVPLILPVSPTSPLPTTLLETLPEFTEAPYSPTPTTSLPEVSWIENEQEPNPHPEEEEDSDDDSSDTEGGAPPEPKPFDASSTSPTTWVTTLPPLPNSNPSPLSPTLPTPKEDTSPLTSPVTSPVLPHRVPNPTSNTPQKGPRSPTTTIVESTKKESSRKWTPSKLFSTQRPVSGVPSRRRTSTEPPPQSDGDASRKGMYVTGKVGRKEWFVRDGTEVWAVVRFLKVLVEGCTVEEGGTRPVRVKDDGTK